MSDNTRMVALINEQKRDLELLYNNNKDKMTQARLDMLQAEIKGLDTRLEKYM